MINLVQTFSEKYCKKKVPQLKPGYHIKVHQKIKEGNKERVQIFEGMVIGVNAGYGTEESFTVRKISEGIGVEKIFPIHLPTIVKIDVLRSHKVRRARLNFLRSLSGKALRLKEVPLNLREKDFVHDIKNDTLVVDEDSVEFALKKKEDPDQPKGDLAIDNEKASVVKEEV